MKAIAALLDRIRGAGANGESDIVQRACLSPDGEPPATKALPTKALPIALAYPIGVKEIGDRLGSDRRAACDRPADGLDAARARRASAGQRQHPALGDAAVACLGHRP